MIMEIHFFGHGKVMENDCWKRLVTLSIVLCSCTVNGRLLSQSLPFIVREHKTTEDGHVLCVSWQNLLLVCFYISSWKMQYIIRYR